ncbi:MAG TPA: SpvB/TcaC N-terminal domain-containing protein [Chitinophagaceae bacterium]|nr:SpvB/TcaC N-terminal domain-containing protein [Chitinophagaceae bacterium]
MPSGGGALRGISEPFKAELFSGSGGFSIPFSLPDPRGFSPVINLSYNSGSGNGLFGLGFSVALDSIVRKTSNGIPRYDDTDVFILGSAGELLPKYADSANGWVKSEYNYTKDKAVWKIVAYRPRIEGAFSLIEQWTDSSTHLSYWKVVTADDITSLYGVSGNGRIYNPQDPLQIFEWLLEVSYDPHGNKIIYNYKQGDTTDIADRIYNRQRDFTSQRYPDTIQYGNYFVTENNEQKEYFAFEVVFDYGQLDKNNPDAASGEWIARPDPFSTYKSGFELRTARLCHGIYLRHYFMEQNNGVPFTTAALLLEYERTSVSGISIIKRIVSRGYRTQPEGSLWIADTPAIELDYQGFDPLDSTWQLLEADAPGYLNSTGFSPIDLEGIGIDGLLYSSDTFTGYLRPLGNGRYAPLRLLHNFPVFKDFQSGQVKLASLDGNNVLDLVVSDGVNNGFFELTDDADWKPFQPFSRFPKEYLSTEKTLADLSGTGRSDLLFFDNSQLKFYASSGKIGFEEASYAYKPALFPATAQQGAEELAGFSDFLGDGLSHRFCLRNGSLVVWPCLGKGHFGEPVTFENAPVVEGSFDASRVFLMDADGSGTTDIVYCHPGYARVWFNQNGNAFSPPVDLVFPATYSAITAVTTGDVSGYGTASLIFTITDPEVKHLYYDFSGQLKPYLLQTIDNGVGGLSSLAYTTSVLEQLRDREEGRIWPTRLPIAVNLVSKIKTTDQITGAAYTQRYRYHDGYFDPVERKFRGFGFIESWDCEAYEAFQASAASDPKVAALPDKDLWVPPIYTRSWFITGAYEQTPAICAQYETQFSKGDAQQWNIPAFKRDADWNDQDAVSIKQAYASLAGQCIRTEVYAEDNTVLANHPYTVSMATALVRLVQPRLSGRYCSAMPVETDALSYTYDRHPEDPRITQNLVLSMDPYGHPLFSAAISFPRRNVAGAVIYPEQQQLRIVVSEAAYINTINSDAGNPDAFWQHLGVNWQARGYEIGGISAPDDAPFTPADLWQQVQTALAHPVGPVDRAPSRTWSRLLSWSRNVYWNNDGTGASPYGEINALALPHHVEAAILDPEEVAHSFGDKVDDALLTNRCGYVLRDGYWWNYGQMQLYNWSSAQFFLPAETKATISGLLPSAVLDENGFNGRTTVQYDPYCMMVIKTSSVLSEIISIDDAYEYDYHSMSPVRHIDANWNVAEVLCDPLGQVIATAVYGQLNGADTGDLPLDQYVIQPEATFEDVVAHPANYLQGATTYFYYDLFAWKNRGQPVNAICVSRTTHVHALTEEGAASEPLMPVSIAYSDGLGTILQTKAKTTPGPVTFKVEDPVDDALADTSVQERWLVSGRTVYNNKGMPVEQYLPYFSATPDFEDQHDIIDQQLVPPPTVIHYDPAGRVVRSDSPKGFFSKVVYGPWETSSYDFNDTVIDSPYYRWFMARYPADPEPWQEKELQALHAALPCYNTPSTVVMDNLGNPIRSIACNLGAIGERTIPDEVASPMTAPAAWNALLEAGYLTKHHPGDTDAWVTAAFQPYLPGFHEAFLQQFPGNGERLEDYLAQSCMTSLAVYDIIGQQLYRADPRLFLKSVREGASLFNFRTEYGLGGQVLQTESADAGLRWSLSNLSDNPVCSWDSRGFRAANIYDNLQRPLGTYITGGDQAAPLANWVQCTVYGETVPDAAGSNLVGKPYQDYDASGLSIVEAYNLAGLPLNRKTYLRPDYKNESNWTAQARQDILNEPSYRRSCIYNALGQLTVETLPDEAMQAYSYDINGFLLTGKQKIVDRHTDEMQPWETVITSIAYDAAGNRTRITYGNGVTTSYTYDVVTRQVSRSYTTRAVTNTQEQNPVLQDVYYTYDPAGHTISTVDKNDTEVFNKNQKISPESTYTYDPVYRIIGAQGRTLPALNVERRSDAAKNSLSFGKVAGIGDLQKLENYTQRFSYDAGNNLVQKRHTAASGSRSQVMTIAGTSNRLNTLSAGSASGNLLDAPPFQYDGNGNMLTLFPGSATQVNWNYLNHIANVVIIARDVTDPETGDSYALNDVEYYQYNSDGNRMRKVTERVVNGGAQVEYTEKIYLGNYQQWRSWTLPSGAGPASPVELSAEKHTLILRDSDAPALITHRWVIAPRAQSNISAGDIQYRYQLCDPLDSVTIEVNEQAGLLTFEQYYVYGGTAFTLARSQLEADAKELRFCGKERDATTGLYYYGARYYATWLGRWMSPDPAGPVDGANLYEYVSSNPVKYNDPTGMGRQNASKAANSGPTKKRSRAEAGLDESAPPAKRRNTKKKLLSRPQIWARTAIADVPEETRQSDLDGIAEKEGRMSYFEVGEDIDRAAEQDKYVFKDGVRAFLKINGAEIGSGKNGKAGEDIVMWDMGRENQRGLKDNPHAEDWTLSSFRNAVDESGQELADFLTEIAPGKEENTGENVRGMNVFSLKINFSPCLGCVNTILLFKEYLEDQLNEEVVLRVKFWRPYDLAHTTKKSTAETAKNFRESVDKLRAGNVFVRMQSDESVGKMVPEWEVPEYPKANMGIIYGADFERGITGRWTDQNINRKAAA